MGKSSRGESKLIQTASGEESGLLSPFMTLVTSRATSKPGGQQAPKAEGHCPIDPLRLGKQGPFKPSPGAAGGVGLEQSFAWAIWHDLFPKQAGLSTWQLHT